MITKLCTVQNCAGVDGLTNLRIFIFSSWLGAQTDFLTFLHRPVCNWSGQLSEEWTSGDPAAVIRRCLVQIPRGVEQSGTKWEPLPDLHFLCAAPGNDGWRVKPSFWVNAPSPPPWSKNNEFSLSGGDNFMHYYLSARGVKQDNGQVVWLLWSPGREGHAVAVLKDHWRTFKRECDVLTPSQPPPSWMFSLSASCLCPSLRQHISKADSQTMRVDGT